MSDYVVKFYQFRLNENVLEGAFIQASKDIDKLLLESDGFVYRSLARVDRSLWQDMIYWKDAEAAANAEKMMARAEVQSFMAMVDAKSLTSTHAKVVTQVYPEMMSQEA